MGEIYDPPPGEYARPPGRYVIPDPRSDDLFDNHFVRGAQFNPEGFAGLEAGQEVEVELVPEPGNPHDKWAVALYVQRKRIGYVAAELAGEWQDVVVALNRSGKLVLASGLINSVASPHATVFLPWLNSVNTVGPRFDDQCGAVLLGWLSRRVARHDELQGSTLPDLYNPQDILDLQQLSSIAPSLNWQSLAPGEGLPVQLNWFLIDAYRQQRGEQRAAEAARCAHAKAEAYRLRAETGMTLAEIGVQVGYSGSTVSKLIKEHVATMTDDEKATAKAALDAGNRGQSRPIPTPTCKKANADPALVIAAQFGLSEGRVHEILKARRAWKDPREYDD